jgi:hypothetical protein
LLSDVSLRSGRTSGKKARTPNKIASLSPLFPTHKAGSCQSRDLWTKSEKGMTQDKLSVTVAAGAGTLYSLHSCH